MVGRRTRFWAGLLADIGEAGFCQRCGWWGARNRASESQGQISVTDLLRDNKISMTKPQAVYLSTLVVNSPDD